MWSSELKKKTRQKSQNSWTEKSIEMKRKRMSIRAFTSSPDKLIFFFLKSYVIEKFISCARTKVWPQSVYSVLISVGRLFDLCVSHQIVCLSATEVHLFIEIYWRYYFVFVFFFRFSKLNIVWNCMKLSRLALTMWSLSLSHSKHRHFDVNFIWTYSFVFESAKIMLFFSYFIVFYIC